MNDIRQLISTPPVSNRPKQSRERITAKRSFADHLPPQERGYQTIPNSDALHTLISRARDAMKQGVFWDRGSIVNITI